MSNPEFLDINSRDWLEPESGTKVLGLVPLLELTDGTPLKLPVVVIKGISEGPTLYVGGGVHGDETGATAIVQRLIQNVEPDQVSGRLICVPNQNPLAVQMRHRLALQMVLRSPMDQGPGDPWQTFPGDENGNGAQVISAKLFDLMQNADAVVDIHTPTIGGRYVPFIFVPPMRIGATAKESLELAHIFRPDYILRASDGIYVSDGTPHVELSRRGIPAFGFEIGEGGRVEGPCTDRGERCVKNLMQHLGMIKADTDGGQKAREVSSMTAVRATRGGLLHPMAELGSAVKEGEVLATVSTSYGKCVEEIRSPHDGPLMRITTLPTVSQSDRIVQVGVEDPS